MILIGGFSLFGGNKYIKIAKRLKGRKDSLSCIIGEA
jgi:hypothetical protein